MKIRRKLYSDSNPKRKHLKFRDIRRLLKDKYLRTKKSRDNEIEMLESGKIGKSVKRTAKHVLPVTVGAGAVGGALVQRLDKDFRALPKKRKNCYWSYERYCWSTDSWKCFGWCYSRY